MSPTPAPLRWTALVREQAASGETIRDFTERRGVNHSSFNGWRGRLRREAREAAAAAASASPFTELTTASSRPQPVDPQLVVVLDAVGAPIHNNLSERMLRQHVVGRRNWLFARSEGGAEAAAAMFTLIGSCWLQGVDPHRYLVDVLGLVQDRKGEVRKLTPQSWRIAMGHPVAP